MTFPNGRDLVRTFNVSKPVFNLVISPDVGGYESFFEEDQNLYDKLFDIQYEILNKIINEKLGIDMSFTVNGVMKLNSNLISFDIELID